MKQISQDKKQVDQNLKAEFERVLADHKAAMLKQKSNINEDLARITSEGLINEDMHLFLEIATNRVGLIEEFGRYRDDTILKHPIINEVRQAKIKIEKEQTIESGEIVQGRGTVRCSLYAYLSHLLGIAKLEADKSFQTKLKEGEEGDFTNETKDDDWGHILD